jgi:hypothetical protein
MKRILGVLIVAAIVGLLATVAIGAISTTSGRWQTMTGNWIHSGYQLFQREVRYDGDAEFNAALNVDGPADFDSTARFDRATDINGILTVDSTATFSDLVYFDGAADFDAACDWAVANTHRAIPTWYASGTITIATSPDTETVTGVTTNSIVVVTSTDTAAAIKATPGAGIIIFDCGKADVVGKWAAFNPLGL